MKLFVAMALGLALMTTSFSAFADEAQARKDCNASTDRVAVELAKTGKTLDQARYFEQCMDRMGYSQSKESRVESQPTRTEAPVERRAARANDAADAYGTARGIVYDALAVYSIVQDIEHRYDYGRFGPFFGGHRPIIQPIRVEGFVPGCSHAVSSPNTFAGAKNWGYSQRITSKC